MNDSQEISYQLARHVPDMKSRVEIQTGYGPLTLYEEDALRVAKVVESILERRLKQALKREAQRGENAAGVFGRLTKTDGKK